MADRNWDARSNHKREPHPLQNEPAYERATDPRQAVRDALDEQMRSRPTTMWQAFWDGFRRA
ncbi:hypothetical protein SAMN04488531_0322 [Corynebacterium coyleae]|uniref:Uncharacterized protein n=1 Tax=Corynebacterium coyleae TaxID=53374 RepID=A0ABX8KY80_9CORY|nr:hypothetical protein [Corynebacterium coyleae]QXB18791.1 hypothetical protein I6L55_01330 [Corynebacterium coyleae]WJY80334.1 hypothetical protein CCOY_08715 [Corynebacterium coyleae]SEB41231.1 hypothetical protein SAMN04488531_0322 [Corynebacterium coyleae]